MRRISTIILAGLGSLVLLVGLVLGGWQAGWWFKTQNTNRQAHVIRQGFSNQQTLRDLITQRIGDYEDIQSQIAKANGDPAFSYLPNQAHAVLNIICHTADQVTGDPLPPDQAQFVQDNCLYGVAK